MLQAARKSSPSTSYGLPLRICGRRYPASCRAIASTAQKHGAAAALRRKPLETFEAERSLRDVRCPVPHTILPTPQPLSEPSQSFEQSRYFPDSGSIALLAIMDACLTNLYDVPRAHQLLTTLRQQSNSTTILDVRIYNRFLRAYFEYAESDTAKKKNAEQWRREAWRLHDLMCQGKEPAVPNEHTNAIMVWGLLKYVNRLLVLCVSSSLRRVPNLDEETRQMMIVPVVRDAAARDVNLQDVVAHPLFSTPDDTSAAIQLLTHAAFQALPRRTAMVVVQQMGVHPAQDKVDTLEQVPEAVPVARRRVSVHGLRHARRH